MTFLFVKFGLCILAYPLSSGVTSDSLRSVSGSTCVAGLSLVSPDGILSVQGEGEAWQRAGRIFGHFTFFFVLTPASLTGLRRCRVVLSSLHCLPEFPLPFGNTNYFFLRIPACVNCPTWQSPLPPRSAEPSRLPSLGCSVADRCAEIHSFSLLEKAA